MGGATAGAGLVPPPVDQLNRPVQQQQQHKQMPPRPNLPPAVLDGASSSSEALGRSSFIAEHLSVSFPASSTPPPIPAQTGVLSPSRSASKANLAGRWRPECDKSICPGLNLYANLK